jgi:hypothetical protein
VIIVSALLFPETDRTYTGPSEYAESYYAYLDRSARPSAQRIRNVMEEWFSRYPEAERGELGSRLRLNDDTIFTSAFFELYLHELLLRLNYSVEVHPKLPRNSTKRPDFFARSQSGQDFYMEAVLASEASEDKRAKEKRMNEVYDTINRLDSPDFFLGMNLRGAPDTPPPGRKIREQLAAWLDDLDPDAVIEDYERRGIEALPRRKFSHEGWNIVFTAIPKKPEARGKPGVRPIGIQEFPFEVTRSKQAIRDAVLKKAERYGQFGKPYVIAVNALSISADRTDVMEALFGTEKYLLPDLSYGLPSDVGLEVTRVPDSAWRDGSGPRYTRVSAALITNSLVPWTAARQNLRLYHNPRAKRPVGGQITQLSEAIPESGQMRWKEGIHPRDLFGLPEGWPLLEVDD